MSSEAENKRRDEILSNHIEELRVHFDSVIIIATKGLPDDTCAIYCNHVGGYYEKYGALKTMCNKFDKDSVENLEA